MRGTRICNSIENQEHLFRCPHIRREYWTRIFDFMDALLIDHERNATFWIVGLYNGKAIDKEAADIVSWAWRTLYAAVVKAHAEDKSIEYSRALLQFHQYAYSRAVAYCVKWQRWYRGQAKWRKPKIIPRKHQDKYMTQMDDVANWAISTEVRIFDSKARLEYTRKHILSTS
jgi:alkylation response protein AidB-like acyl-CoA dehydrogenase